MKRFVAYALAALLGTATAAWAETCVTSTFDRPLPGATNVETRLADVPSTRFPGLWQEGRIDGFFYRIWSNNEAVLQPGATAPSWTITITCAAPADGCQRSIDGTPTDQALQTAIGLEQCLADSDYAGPQTGPVASPAIPEASGQDTASITTDPLSPPDENAETTPASPCGLASIPQSAGGLTLQRLVVAAGGNPGPLDGLVGPKTYRALVEILGTSAAQLDQPAAIIALDRYLCEPNP